jgi:hypothetical protein
MTGAAQVARRENHCVNQIAGQILPGEKAAEIIGSFFYLRNTSKYMR